MKTQVNLKIDAQVKKSAQKRAKEIGLSLSSIVNATLGQFARTGTLEFSVAQKPTPFLQAIIKEARADYEAGNIEVFENVDDFIASLPKK